MTRYIKYDAFISFKNTVPGTSELTPDRKIAETLHRQLTEEGMKVFFSEKDLSETDFIDEIYSALDSASLIIVIGTCAEYVNSRWVKSEWSNFFGAINSGRKPNGKIITLLGGMNKHDLPLMLANCESFDARNMDDCVRYAFRTLGLVPNSEARAYEQRQKELQKQREEAERLEKIKRQMQLDKKAQKKAQAAKTREWLSKNGARTAKTGVIMLLAAALIWGCVTYVPGIVKDIRETVIAQQEQAEPQTEEPDKTADTQDVTTDPEENKSAEPDEESVNVYNNAECGYIDSNVSYKVGDRVLFGSYEQDGDENNGKEAIEWRILDKTDDELLLISEYLLDALPYNEKLTSVTWETCTLRKWLNDDFYDAAFSTEEKSRIVQRTNENPSNNGIKGGNPTEDKVFCLSIAEADKYFSSADDRQAKPTVYARKNGAYVSSDYGTGWWWLRSPGFYSTYAALGGTSGNVSRDGNYVDDGNSCVRPVVLASL